MALHKQINGPVKKCRTTTNPSRVIRDRELPPSHIANSRVQDLGMTDVNLGLTNILEPDRWIREHDIKVEDILPQLYPGHYLNNILHLPDYVSVVLFETDNKQVFVNH